MPKSRMRRPLLGDRWWGHIQDRLPDPRARGVAARLLRGALRECEAREPLGEEEQGADAPRGAVAGPAAPEVVAVVMNPSF